MKLQSFLQQCQQRFQTLWAFFVAWVARFRDSRPITPRDKSRDTAAIDACDITIRDNPYLQSRKLWTDLYGDAQARYQSSRKLNQRLLMLVGLCIVGIAYIGSQSKFVPFVVEVQDGRVIYTHAASSSNFDGMKASLSRYFIQTFVKSARSVSVDGLVERNHQAQSFALTQGAGTTELSDFYKAHDPYKIVSKQTRSIKINYVNTLPGQAFQVGWTESDRNSQTGDVLSERQYVGEFEYTWGKPSQDSYILQNNPFGFYITNISWTGVR